MPGVYTGGSASAPWRPCREVAGGVTAQEGGHRHRTRTTVADMLTR
jgi:hypothetical protein